MEHLNKNDIIRFVTTDKINEESLEMFSTVNAHIRNCAECRDAVAQALQYYDRLKFNADVDLETELKPEAQLFSDYFDNLNLERE